MRAAAAKGTGCKLADNFATADLHGKYFFKMLDGDQKALPYWWEQHAQWYYECSDSTLILERTLVFQSQYPVISLRFLAMNRNISELNGMKMCLNHSQSGIEEGLAELEQDFRSWLEHPHQRVTWSKLMEHLVSFRWVLDQHFTRVAGEGYLENVACQRPGLYSDLREIECWQCRLIDQLDLTIHHVQNYDPQRDEIADMAEQFQRLHREILEEECQERQLVERGLA